ncbi:Transmembrane 9 superfamily member 1 [Venturia nashicola]|nr:Transmembrane 9 superfamily member 1 [Venturia nashicola]
MPSSNDQSGNLVTSPSSIPKTVSPHLSHDIYGEIDPPWLLQVLEFPWRNQDNPDYDDRRNHDQKFDLLTWLVESLDPKSRGALRRVHSGIKRIFPDACLFNTLRITPRKTDPFKHLSKNALRTIGKHCREIRILFDAVSFKEAVDSVQSASRRLQEGHDDGEDWKRIFLRLRNTTKIALRTTAKGSGYVISPANISMLTEPFRQNLQYADFLRNLTTLKLVPMHVPYIVNFCSLGTDCKTESWTAGKIWSQITELECQFYVQEEGGGYEIDWEHILQTLQRWLRGFKKNLRTLKFHWIVFENASGPRPHPLALEKWLPEKDEFVESPIFWNSLTTLAIGNVEFHEDDADSELNLLDSRVPTLEVYYRLRNATGWAIVDFTFESHESNHWKSFERLANGRWKDPPGPPGAERPQQRRSRQQSLHSIRTESNPRATQLQGLESKSPNLRASKILPDLYLAIEDGLDMFRSQQGLSGLSGRSQEGFGQLSPHSLQSRQFIKPIPSQRFKFEDDEDGDEKEEESYTQQRPKQVSNGLRENSGFSPPMSPRSRHLLAPDRQVIGTRTGKNLGFTQQPNLSSILREHGESDADQQDSRSRQPSRARDGSRDNSQTSPQPQDPVSMSHPSYNSTTTLTQATFESRQYLDFDETHETDGQIASSDERVPNSRGQSNLEPLATYPSNLHEEPAILDSALTRELGSRYPPLSSSAKSSVSSKYSTTQPTALSRTETRSEPLRRPAPGHNEDPWSHKESFHRSYEHSNYVTIVESPAVTGYDEFMGNPFADDDQSDGKTLVSAGPSDVYRGHVAALEADLRSSSSSAGERRDTDSRREQSRHNLSIRNIPLTRPTRIRRSTPPEMTQSLAGMENQGRRRRSEFDAPEVVPVYAGPLLPEEHVAISNRRSELDTPEVIPAPLCPLLPEEHVAISRRNGHRHGLALVQPGNSGLFTEGRPQEQVIHQHFDLDSLPSPLDNHHSASEPEQPSRPHGRHHSSPVENVRGDVVSALSAREAERRSKDSILSGSYFPTKMSSPVGPKKGFMSKMFKRQNSEESTTSKVIKRDSKTSNGSDDAGKRRSFGKVRDGVKDSVKTVEDGGKATSTIGRAVVGL